MLHIVRYLLQNGARPAINHGKNSALACVLRQVRYNRRIVNMKAELYDFKLYMTPYICMSSTFIETRFQ